MTALAATNKSRFVFTCDGIDDASIHVVKFAGTDSISQPYTFTILLSSLSADIDEESLINKKATLFLRRYDEFYPYSGIIAGFKYLGTNVDYTTYEVVIRPQLWRLQLTTQTRVFQKMSIPDIVERVLSDAGLDNYYSMDVGTYPLREYVVQYQETDLNFISRLMEECGIWYFFEEMSLLEDEVPDATTGEQMVITDKCSGFKEVATESVLRFRSGTGMVERIAIEDKEFIYRLESSRLLTPREVMVKNYNYRTPEVDLVAKKQIEGGDVGKVYEYGGNFKDTTGGMKCADVIARRNATGKAVFKGDGNCAGLRAGNRFSIIEHPREKLNDQYVLIEVIHHGIHPESRGSNKEISYQNNIAFITAANAEMYAPQRKALLPRIPGIMTGLIEGEGSDYAALDDTGRYKIRMPFDVSGIRNSGASKYVRLAQPYSGADYGMHFPSHEGTEMIVGHIDGDPDKPLGLGTIPNANTMTPVKSTNKEKSTLRTAGGNELIMDDTDSAKKMSLYTPYDMSLTSDHDMSVAVGNNRSKTVTKNESNTIKGNRSTTVDGTFTETVKGETKITISEGNETWRIEGGSLTTFVAKAVDETYDANQKTTVKGPIEIASSTGEIKITAATTITLTCGQSCIKMSSDGTIDVTGTKVSITAKTGLASIAGVEVSVAAKGNLKMSGSNIESAAKVSNAISGSMVSTDGKAINVVKGGMVQLNP